MKYYRTIYEIAPSIWTQYTINRIGLSYDLKCHMSGAGTDIIIIGTLGQCYQELRRQLK